MSLSSTSIIQGTCCTCGQIGSGEDAKTWFSSRGRFTDYDKLQRGNLVCIACLFCFDEQSSNLQDIRQKDRPQRMRNYSHFVLDGKWIPLNASKADRKRMVSLLVDHRPEVAIVAKSGQKHIIFRCQPYLWQWEEATIQPCPVELRGLLSMIEVLYNGGFNKNEINGKENPSIHQVTKYGSDRWLRNQKLVSRNQGTYIFELALWLIGREEEEEEENEQKA